MTYSLFGRLLHTFDHCPTHHGWCNGSYWYCLQLKPGHQIPSPSELMGKILIKNKKGPTPKPPAPPKKTEEETHAENTGENIHRFSYKPNLPNISWIS